MLTRVKLFYLFALIFSKYGWWNWKANEICSSGGKKRIKSRVSHTRLICTVEVFWSTSFFHKGNSQMTWLQLSCGLKSVIRPCPEHPRKGAVWQVGYAHSSTLKFFCYSYVSVLSSSLFCKDLGGVARRASISQKYLLYLILLDVFEWKC